MTTQPEKLMQMQAEALEASRQAAAKTLEGWQKLAQLNLQTARASLEQSSEQINALLAARGAPYALVHTVGDFAEQPLLGTDLPTWRHLFTSNVDTAFHAVQAVVPAMAAARRGRVVLFAAAGVDKDRGMLRAPAYFAAKAALVQLARSLALEVASAGLTVNVVAPGLIDHPHSHRASQARMLPRVPAGRLGHVDDVVAMVRYLLSDAGAYVTGQVLTVDGGLQA